MIFTPKNIGYRARSKAKDHRTLLLGLLIEKQNRVLGMRARLFACLRLLRRAILRNHLK